ncbi:hypothetical protein AB0A95_33355 [Micromonospora sp. NPDC049230]|uniref:hypothetical protein n=1 Tax=Micromonospora sp. NPDC049230 TaxID=3155502 RepID=UPI0033DE24C7
MARPQFDPATKKIEIPTPIAGSALTFKLGQKTLNDEQMTYLAPLGIRADWSPAYVIAFLNECHSRRFDPWSGEAFLLRYPDGYVRHIGIAGWLRSAEETQGFAGIDRVVFFDENDKGWLRWPHRDQVPYAAEATVHRRDRVPQTAPVLYHEYVPMVEDTQVVKMPDGTRFKIPTGKGKVPKLSWRAGVEGGKATMLMSKVARAASLRLQFPRFGGWYEAAELARAAVEVRNHDLGEVAEQRRTAYQAAQVEQAGRTVDGADVGATVRETGAAVRESITVTRAATTGPVGKKWTESEVRARLLAELRAQAELLGMSADAMTRRWSAARGGQAFENASVRDMTEYVQRFRSYVIDRLRATGRHQLATAYAAAPVIGSVQDLFGVAEPWTVAGDQVAVERESVGVAA